MKGLGAKEMAALCGSTVKALRVYQGEGLVDPAWVDEETGRRRYSPEQCSSVDAVRRFGALGFTLKEIRALLACEDSSTIAQTIDDKVDETERRLLHALQTVREGRLLARQYRLLDDDSQFGRVILRRRDAYGLLRFPQQTRRTYTPELSVADDVRNWHCCMQEALRQAEKQGLGHLIRMNVGSLVRQELLETRTFESSEIVMVCGPEHARNEPAVSPLPEATCLTVLNRRTYDPRTDTFSQDMSEYEMLSSLVDDAQKRGLLIAGDCISLTIVETPACERRPWSNVTLAHVPVVG